MIHVRGERYCGGRWGLRTALPSESLCGCLPSSALNSGSESASASTIFSFYSFLSLSPYTSHVTRDARHYLKRLASYPQEIAGARADQCYLVPCPSTVPYSPRSLQRFKLMPSVRSNRKSLSTHPFSRVPTNPVTSDHGYSNNSGQIF